jgi:hypothetical protein
MPIAFIPTVSIEYKGYSINVVHIPEIVEGTRTIDEVTYINFGIDF